MESKEQVVNYDDSGLHLLADAVLLLEQQSDCRSNNGSKENQRLDYIVERYNKALINNIDKLEELFSETDLDVSTIKSFSKAGGCNKHYDLIIHFIDDSTKTIEHKGIKMTKKSPVNDFERPWSLTPQLLNETYQFARTSIYLDLWYTKAMPELKAKWPDLPEFPSYNEWIKLDASMGSAKSDWGKALKIKRQLSKANLTFIDNIYKKYLKQFWTTISSNSEFMEELKQDLFTNISLVLEDKNYWINTFYKTSKEIVPEFSFISKTPQISNLNIEIDLGTSKNLPKAILKYNLTSNPDKIFIGEARLRWGNGNGISNIRWNIS